MKNTYTYLTDNDITRLRSELEDKTNTMDDIMSVINDIVEEHSEQHYDFGYNNGYTDCSDNWL